MSAPPECTRSLLLPGADLRVFLAPGPPLGKPMTHQIEPPLVMTGDDRVRPARDGW